MSKEESSGLLSKVVRFVTSPTTNWSDLNQPEEDRDSLYNKQALKEMIERKRRNDFVRRREFDQLRKLRKREALNPPPDQVRPSFFQSSMASRTEDRAGTLKKIDEIEAQMSMQWWRAKHGQPPPAGAAPGATAVPVNAFAPTRPAGLETVPAALATPASVPVTVPKPFEINTDAMSLGPASAVDPSMLRPATTTPASLPASTLLGAARWDATQPATNFPAFAPTAVQPSAAPQPDFSASRLLGPETQVFVHQPELEEAAIRYANGDFEGAESALMELLRQPAMARRELLWMALFDLYRTTGQQDRFDSASIDFAGLFGRSGPLWRHWSAESDVPRAGRGELSAEQAPGYQWIAPPLLTRAVLEALQAALERAAPPWLLDWTRLTGIEPQAVERLADLAAEWASARVRLRWQGHERLDELLRAHTISGQAETEQAWWRLRMEVLRLLGHADEFELVALDYCVTYELSPPSWQAPYCECLLVSGDGSPLEAVMAAPAEAPVTQLSRYQTDFASTALAGDLSSVDFGLGEAAPISVSLSGEVTSDVEGSLPVPLPGYQIPRVLVVDCSRLVRIDFSAAGSVLNWAAARQAEGTQVQFQQLNRLVAVFFNVIGINEHARVLPRQD